MPDKEIKIAVYIGVSAFLLAAVLSMICYCISLRNDFADVRNAEIQTAQKLKEYREFNKYNDTIVYGEDIIEAIRKYHNTDVEIYVDSVSGGTSDWYVTDGRSKLALNEVINGVETNSLVGIPKLQSIFKYNYEYSAVLVYDNMDVQKVLKKDKSTNLSNEVTGIVFFFNKIVVV